MSDFAKVSMVGLICRQLRQTNPELLPAAPANGDTVRNARIPAIKKRDFLDLIWREAGPLTLLCIGQNIRDISYDPVWRDAVRSANPQIVFEKWRRFEIFGHSRNRLKIECDGENFASFHRYSVHGNAPTTPENLLICGLIIALLEVTGCEDLRCDMNLDDGSTHPIRENRQFFVPRDFGLLDTTGWTVRWRNFSATYENPRSEQTLPKINFSASIGASARNRVLDFVGILMREVSRPWRVENLAEAAGLSKRTLQRRLHESGLSFSHLVRLVRIHEACRLLQQRDTSITIVGYCTGFSDSAHFSRDFLASMGMTPSDYRSVWNTAKTNEILR